MKYRVNVGQHIQKDTVYKKGEIVDTWQELDKLFPQKFTRVYEQDLPPAPVLPVVYPPPGQAVDPSFSLPPAASTEPAWEDTPKKPARGKPTKRELVPA